MIGRKLFIANGLRPIMKILFRLPVAKKRRRWHTQVMLAAAASDTALGLPTELRSLQLCTEGLGLLKAFVRQPETPPAAGPQRYRGFQGDPLWRAFTQHWAICAACQQSHSDLCS